MRRAILVSGAFVFGVIAIEACGSDNDDIPQPAADAGADVSTSSSSSGFVPTDSGPNDGKDSASGDGGGSVPECPTYQTRCDGTCIPTTDDAQHCGGCDTKCTGTQACSAGKCSDTCQVGLDVCANRCVDKQSDNQHCGTCGKACATGEGCVAGACVKAIVVGPAPGKCVGGGPAIINKPEEGGCLGNLAQTTFRWSLCSCNNVTYSSKLTADAYDSSQGPYVAGGNGGGVGVNNSAQASGETTIGGDYWIHGTNGSAVSNITAVRHDLKVNGNLTSGAQSYTVGHDAFINGNVVSGGDVKITNELTVPAANSIGPKVTAGKTTRAAVSFPPPCDCETQQLVPIAAIVAAHAAAANNDNVSIGLKDDALVNPADPTRLDLPCGQYYLKSIGGSKAITVAAHGRTAIYIDGDINLAGELTFTVDPIGELDIFVTGGITSSKPLHIGSPNFPALTRTYVGTTGSFALSSDVRVGGNLWVGKGTIAWSGNSDFYGSLFAKDFNASSETNIHYDRAVLNAGNSCPGGNATGGGDAGTAPTCTSCRDCANQACNAGKCGACQTSADCCSPLQCVSGECIAAVK